MREIESFSRLFKDIFREKLGFLKTLSENGGFKNKLQAFLK
jgi:hypothetical protein